MGMWSSLANALKVLFKSGGAAQTAGKWTKIWTVGGTRNIMTITKGATDAARASFATMLTWGNAFKVAVVGGFSYLFLTGGASNVVASTLGISPEIAQVIIIALFLFLLFLAVRYLFHYISDRFGLKQEYFDEPIIHMKGRNQYAYRPNGRNNQYANRPYDRRYRRCSG